MNPSGVEDRMSVVWEKGVVSVWVWERGEDRVCGCDRVGKTGCVGVGVLSVPAALGADGPVPVCCRDQHHCSQGLQHLPPEGGRSQVASGLSCSSLSRRV